MSLGEPKDDIPGMVEDDIGDDAVDGIEIILDSESKQQNKLVRTLIFKEMKTKSCSASVELRKQVENQCSSDELSDHDFSENYDCEGASDFLGKRDVYERFKRLVEYARAHAFSIFYLLLTLALLVTSIYLWSQDIETEWLNISTWRWTFYLTLLFPSYTLAHLTLKLLCLILRSLVRYQIYGPNAHDDRYRVIHDVELFFQNYWKMVRLFIWSCYCTLIFSLCFSPAYGSAEELSRMGIEEWEDIYSFIQRLHFVLMLFLGGKVLIDLVEFKYLHTFSSKNLLPKMYSSIFEEVVLATLAGYTPARAPLLLPHRLFKSPLTQFDLHNNNSKSRREYAATSYLSGHSLEYAFGVRMHLANRITEFVVEKLLEHILYNLNVSRIKQTNQTTEKHDITAECDNPSALDYQEGTEIVETAEDEKKEPSIDKKTEKEHQLASSYENHGNKYGVTGLKSTRKRFETVSMALLESIIRNAYDGSLNVTEARRFLDPSEKAEHVSFEILRDKVLRSFTNRRNLINSISDSAIITGQIKLWISIIVSVFLIMLAFIIMGFKAIETWVAFSTVIFGFSFMFGGAAKDSFDNFLYLYGTHPFDVGDSVLLGTRKIYTVERVMLQTTEFQSFGETRIIQNLKLRNIEPFVNLSRSTSHWLFCKFIVDVGSVTSKFLDSLSKDMKAFFDEDQESYSGEFRIDAYEFVPGLKINLTLGFRVNFAQLTYAPSRICQTKAAVRFASSILEHGGTYTVYLDESGAR